MNQLYAPIAIDGAAPEPGAPIAARDCDLDLAPYRVNADLVAVRAVCAHCGQQYDVRFTRIYYEAAGADMLYFDANREALCEVCYRLGEDFGTELLPSIPPQIVEARNLSVDLVIRLIDIETKLDRLLLSLAAVDVPAAPLGLDAVDLRRLSDLCARHLDMTLLDALKRFNLGSAAQFGEAYPDFALASKALTYAVIKHAYPIKIFQARTLIARNRSLYLSLDFGFGTVAYFSNDELDDTFRPTPHLLAPWRQAGFVYDFNPFITVQLTYDSKSYPRIVEILHVAEGNHAS